MVIKIYPDFNHVVEGGQFISDRNGPVNIDGKMSAKERELDRKTPQWMGMTDHEHTNFLSAQFDSQILEQVQANLYYMDDPSSIDNIMKRE